MAKTSRPRLSLRKQPRQARSAQLVSDILEAAVRVLRKEGGARFTTVRVAEAAGVSVGSLYQYFPNKAALLFRLQSIEWTETWAAVEGLLRDGREPPLSRLRRAVQAFFRSEHEEAVLRVALDDAGALFRDAPEARALVRKSRRSMEAFLAEAAPAAPAAARTFAADFLMTSMGAVAEKVTEQGRSRAEVDAWAAASAELYCAYVKNLARAVPTRGRAR